MAGGDGDCSVGQSYNFTFTSYPTWELAAYPVGTATGDSRIRSSLSNQGGLTESCEVTDH
jgi:hypothetical protein